MKTISLNKMRQIESWAIDELGIPAAVLMENAGRSVAETILKEQGLLKKVCVIMGKGNNGGDGAVCARHLLGAGVQVHTFLLGKKENLKGSAQANLQALNKMFVPIFELTKEEDLKNFATILSETDLIIDAIFGIGFKGEMDNFTGRIVGLVNASKKPTCAVDIPSGLDVDTGKVGKHCIEANLTVTFHLPKIGLLQHPGTKYVGKLAVANIGIPQKDIVNLPSTEKKEEVPTKEAKKHLNIEITDINFVSTSLPPRKIDAHKGDCGKVLIIAGSLGMTGAAILTARGALRVGAGLVYLGLPKSLQNTVDAAIPEAITLGLAETAKKALAEQSLNDIIKKAKEVDVLALGPGLSTNQETVKLVINLVKKAQKLENLKALVIDADALNALAQDQPEIGSWNLGPQTIITPHPGEMARLLRLTIQNIQTDRIGIAQQAAKKWNAVVVLKGAQTVTAHPDGKTFVNSTGNPGMASGGVGDVLTGAIAGLVAQGAPPLTAATSGTFIHGMAGDTVSLIKGQQGLLASDIVEALPYVLESIARKTL